MDGILEAIGSFFTIIKTIFVGKNTADEVANKEGSDDQQVKAGVESDIAKKDAGAVGRDIST
jgi:hypothetical protein